MRIWTHSLVKSTALAPSSAFSVVVHAVLIGAAVYGTGVNARAIEQAIAQKIYYLPPPDRRPSSEHVVEHIQYMEVGSQSSVTNERADGQVAARTGQGSKSQLGGDAGAQEDTQTPSLALESRDSVYSILDVEESATRAEGSAAPAYPVELMKEGKEGGVFIRFVVDSSGRADSTTIEVVRASHPLFALAVRQAVPQMMFSPASMGGRHVRQAVEQNFEFRIAPPAPATPPEQTKTPKPVP